MPTPDTQVLPGYTWDSRLGTGRFRDARTGRMISSRTIAQTLATVQDSTAQQLGAMARAAVEGEISVAVFQRAAMEVLKQTSAGATALAHGGWDRVPQAAWGRTGASLKREYRYLAEFAREIANGTIGADAAATRAELYADAAYGRYWAESQRRAAERNYGAERLITAGDDRVCPTCREQESRSWQPIGAFAVPVHLRCRCRLRYYGDEA